MRRIRRVGLLLLLGAVAPACDSWGPTETDEDDPIVLVGEIKDDPSLHGDVPQAPGMAWERRWVSCRKSVSRMRSW
jgi:hypothetical protein